MGQARRQAEGQWQEENEGEVNRGYLQAWGSLLVQIPVAREVNPRVHEAGNEKVAARWKPHTVRPLLKASSECSGRGGCFDEVIPRFHSVAGDGVRDEFYVRVGDYLHLREGVVGFLRSDYRVLQLLAIGGWVRFTEQFTFVPRLYEKIAGLPPERKHSRYRNFLVTIQDNNCFYCGKSHEVLHVDHVIPWSFVLEDRIWNLVLACSACNCAKSDMTPEDESIAQLIRRNANLFVGRIAENLATEERGQAVICRDSLRRLCKLTS
jgi:hypothetical protein